MNVEIVNLNYWNQIISIYSG